jgi:hypothetical protein
MKVRKATRGGARKRPCPVAQLASTMERLCAAHLAADEASVRGGKSSKAILETFHHERDAIAIRASHLAAQSAAGAAFQLALAAADAELLSSSVLSNDDEAEAIQARMNRLLVHAAQYLASIGGVLPPTVASYNMAGLTQ